MTTLATQPPETPKPLTPPAPALRPARLDWKLIGMGVPLGLIVAGATIAGLGSLWWEIVAWGLVGFAWIGLVWLRSPGRPFLHGFLVTFLGSLLAILLQTIFVDAFLAAHPSLDESIMANNLSPRVFVFATGVLGSAVTGVVVGLFAVFATSPGDDEE